MIKLVGLRKFVLRCCDFRAKFGEYYNAIQFNADKQNPTYGLHFMLPSVITTKIKEI